MQHVLHVSLYLILRRSYQSTWSVICQQQSQNSHLRVNVYFLSDVLYLPYPGVAAA